MASLLLRSYYIRFHQESLWILEQFLISVNAIRKNPPSEKHSRLAAEMGVVRLHDAWARFSRNLVIVSAGGRPYTENGLRLRTAPGVKRIQDVIPTLLSSYKKRTLEPPWAIPKESIDAAQRLAIHNFTTFSAAIGSTPSPAEEMRPLRNFVAHRGKGTANAVRQQGFFFYGDRVSIEAVAGDFVQPGITRFEHWVAGMQIIARAAIQ